MKIQKSIRDLYDEQRPLVEVLKADVDRGMEALRATRWHYESRIKSLESFANKIESGRVKDPRKLEDFLACTLVVPNSSSISDALKLVRGRYQIEYRRPPDPASTKKAADAFPFDDLRLYCIRGNDGTLPEDPIDHIVFEVQIKTFLQHAWGVATHDLSYKTDDVRWGKDRIVASLKASIEYAELTIQQADQLSRSELVSLAHEATDEIARIIELLKRHWERDDLPENLRGLATSLMPIFRGLKVGIDDVDAMLIEEKVRLGGDLPLNLSPYGTVIQTLLSSKAREFDDFLKNNRSHFRILATPELNIPDGFPTQEASSKVVRLQ